MNRVLLANIGEIAVNAFSVISYITSFAVGIFLGVSQGAQPLFGQAYGEKNGKDLKHYFKVSAAVDFIGSALLYWKYSQQCIWGRYDNSKICSGNFAEVCLGLYIYVA